MDDGKSTSTLVKYYQSVIFNVGIKFLTEKRKMKKKRQKPHNNNCIAVGTGDVM